MHSSPPLAGVGLVHVRDLDAVPNKQYLDSVHVVQEDQAVQPPSTAPIVTRQRHVGNMFLTHSYIKAVFKRLKCTIL